MNERKHYLTPIKGKIRSGRHLFLWIETDETEPVLRTTTNRAWDILWGADHLDVHCAGPWSGAADLERLLDKCTAGKGTLTVWLARGWEDLVLSGLAQLLDSGAFVWRYALIDGQRVLIRGTWRGRSIVVTSLANWTGCRYDSWPKVIEDHGIQMLVGGIATAASDAGQALSARERLALSTWGACAMAARLLRSVSLAPTVAGAAVQVWRRFLGPTFAVYVRKKDKRGRLTKEKPMRIVAPSPYRPDRAALAERHCCYGLFLRYLRQGAVDEPIYCLDMRGAYAMALSISPLPLQYERTLYQPTLEELVDKLTGKTGHALVRVDTLDWAYPVRRQRTVHPAIGQYWTWLAAAELVHALTSGHVKECYTAYIWSMARVEPAAQECLLMLSASLGHDGSAGVGAAWRAIYSALVGQFAGRRQHWRDLAPRGGVERWSQWVTADVQTGQLRRCRSIAGRQQQLVDNTDTSASVPLVYASVTAWVRWMGQMLLNIAGVENTVALVADSLWVTRKGWQRLLKRCSQVGMRPDDLRTKAVFDRCYFDGKSAVICERNGQRILRVPGCRDGTTLDADYRATDYVAPPWGSTPSFDPSAGIARRKRTFAGQRLIDQCSHPAIIQPIGEPLDDPLLRPELLERPRWGRTVADE